MPCFSFFVFLNRADETKETRQRGEEEAEGSAIAVVVLLSLIARSRGTCCSR